MNGNGARNFTYLNRDGRWPGFSAQGLEQRDDGAWQLASVPLLLDELPSAAADLPAPGAPAGLAAAPDGTLYYTRPDAHRVMRVEGCAGARQPVPCLGGEGSGLTQFSTPRSVLVHPARPALVVADSGNDRLQLFDPETFELRDIWGGPGSRPGEFDGPWALAADEVGNVYVVDHGNRRVQKFDLRGSVITAFAERAGAALAEPVGIVASGRGAATRVYVLDAGANALVVLNGKGNALAAHDLAPVTQPLALAVHGRDVYVGDNGARRLYRFALSEDGASLAFVGAAEGYEGPVAALAIDGSGALWLLPGGESDPLRLGPGQAHLKRGVLWGGPVSQLYAVRWHELQAQAGPLPEGAHLQLFMFTSDEFTPTPPDVGQSPPFLPDDWLPLPPDVTAGLVPGVIVEQGDREPLTHNFLPAQHLWLGALFEGDGLASAALEQVRVSYDHATYRQHLPAIYSRERGQRELLDRLLALFEGVYAEVEGQIAALSTLFDPQAAPAAWLHWLAAWVGLELDERWTEAQQREAITGALARYARRGTVAGLQEALRLFAGVEARVEEPLLYAGWWSLSPSDDPDEAGAIGAGLGVGTMLASAEADGAIAGSTATLDRSHLIGGDEQGAHLFAHMAHQFTVQIHRAQAEQAGLLDRVHAVIEREKPAHTRYHLCIIEPKMRIGFQARLGIDTVVAGPVEPTALGQTSDPAQPGPRLGGDEPGRLGDDIRIGGGTRLG